MKRERAPINSSTNIVNIQCIYGTTDSIPYICIVHSVVFINAIQESQKLTINQDKYTSYLSSVLNIDREMRSSGSLHSAVW